MNIDPVLVTSDGALEYKYRQRNDDANLIYAVEVRTNLLSGNWTEINNQTRTNSVDASIDEVISAVPTDSACSYLRLKVVK